MAPKIDLNGDMAKILERLSHETDSLNWKCADCNIERTAPLKAADIADVKAYIRRQKKQWWQFWIR
jgi:hypothetical protein